MNHRTTAHLSCLLISAVGFLLIRSPAAYAVTLDDLADMCEAMESAIVDVAVEYEWIVDPAPTIEDIAGTSRTIVKGPQKCTWFTKRPFAERSLMIQRQTNLNQSADPSDSVVMESFNGRVAKYASVSSGLPDGTKGTLSRGVITEVRRFTVPEGQPPMVFCILAIHGQDKTIRLSTALRKEGFVYFEENQGEMNGFPTARADLLIEAPSSSAACKLPYTRVYFSTAHSCTPVRYEYVSPTANGPQVTASVDVTSLEQVSPGLWFPSAGCLTLAGDNLKNRYQATRIVVNQGLSDEDFHVEFPPGTHVKDEVTRVRYVVKSTEEPFEKWLENKASLAMITKARTASNTISAADAGGSLVPSSVQSSRRFGSHNTITAAI
ncbi:MAG: hypothetical protein KBE65_11215 [Phycisphaerae bacterium]|nr:hypothetical protein [Phycisphaerae bacterium]